jgi:phospholipase/carboxylesterase
MMSVRVDDQRRRYCAHTLAMADFIETVSARYSLAREPIGIGAANGATMAAALLLVRPRLPAGAILLRPLVLFRDDLLTRLLGTPNHYHQLGQ